MQILGERVATLETTFNEREREHQEIFEQLRENRKKMDETIAAANAALLKFSSAVGYNKALVAIIVAQTLIIGLLAGHALP